MATGRSGVYGKSVQRAVDKVTGRGPEPAVTHQLSMAGSPVTAVLWIRSCVILGLAQVREERFQISCTQGAAQIGFFISSKPEFSQLVSNC